MARRAQAEKPPEQSPGQYWHAQIEQTDKAYEKWQERGKKVVKRYRDERDAIESQRKKFNILWSNIQVLIPSLYGRAAKPEVSRRHMDQDPVARLASTMVERVIDYETEQFPDFDAAMKGAVEDRLLPGRGTAWIRFAPNLVTEEPQPTPSQEVAEEGPQITSKAEDPPMERVDSAHSPVDYVYWMDFMHSPARTWEEVWWVGRWVYMTKEEGIERFGEVFNNVPIESEDSAKDWKGNEQKKASLDKKAKVAEIWDKRTGKVCWVAKGYPQQLDERDDPLGLEGFFPCPRPLYATTTTGSLIPVPDYCEYEDQASELDSLTNRRAMLLKSIKAVGVFNAEFKELQRMLNEGIDNKLFPVTAWAALAEKGGLKGAVDMLDLTTQIEAYHALGEGVESVKLTIYETMGLSDILRGSSEASETLGAQQLKAQFGSLRLKTSQADVARFASDIFRLKAQIICKFYPPEYIVQVSGVMDTEDGKNPEMLMAAIAMLRDSTVRDFRIQVESDSLAQIDEQAEKQAATEVTAAIGTFLKEALPVVQAAPEMLPLVKEMLLFTLRRYRAGRSLEASIETAMKALEAKIQQAQQNPQPNPEMAKVQAEQAADQARMQADVQVAQQQAQFDAALEQQRIAMEERAREREAAMEERLRAIEAANDVKFQAWKAELDAQTKVQVAQVSAGATIDAAQISASNQASQA